MHLISSMPMYCVVPGLWTMPSGLMSRCAGNVLSGNVSAASGNVHVSLASCMMYSSGSCMVPTCVTASIFCTAK